MKLTCRQDVDAPAAFVFARLADFDGWERAALRRGADVTRTAQGGADGDGMGWSLTFPWRGKLRQAALRLDALDPPNRMVLSGVGANLDGGLALDVLEMAPLRSRITVKLEIRPRTLVARLFVQSMKLARARIESRLRKRAAMVAAEIEARYRQNGRA